MPPPRLVGYDPATGRGRYVTDTGETVDVATGDAPSALDPHVADLSVFFPMGEDPVVGLDSSYADRALAERQARAREAADSVPHADFSVALPRTADPVVGDRFAADRAYEEALAGAEVASEIGADARAREMAGRPDLGPPPEALPPALGGAPAPVAPPVPGDFPFAGSFPGDTAAPAPPGAHAVDPSLDPAVSLPAPEFFDLPPLTPEQQQQAAQRRLAEGIRRRMGGLPVPESEDGIEEPLVDLAGGAGGPAPGTAPRWRGGARRAAAPAAPAEPPLIDDERLLGGILYDRREPSALDRQRGLLDERRRLEQRRAEAAAGAEADALDALTDAEERRRQTEAMRVRAEGEARDRYDRAVSRISRDAFFEDQGLGGTLSAIFAVALGAAGQAITGDPENAALALIERQIQQAREDARSRADGAQTAYSMTRDEFTSRQAADEAFRAAALDEVRGQLAITAANLDSEEAQLRARELDAQLLREAEAARAAAQQQEIDSLLERETAIARLRRLRAQAAREERRAMGGGAGAAGGRVTSPMLDAYDRLLSAGLPPAEAALRAGIPADTAGMLTQGTGRDQQRSQLDALDAELRHIEGLLPPEDEDVPGVGLTGYLPDLLVSDEGRELRQALENLSDLMGRLRSGAAISEEEELRFRRIIGAAAGQRDVDLRRGIETVRRELRARISRGGRTASAGEERSAFEGSLGAREVVE